MTEPADSPDPKRPAASEPTEATPEPRPTATTPPSAPAEATPEPRPSATTPPSGPAEATPESPSTPTSTPAEASGRDSASGPAEAAPVPASAPAEASAPPNTTFPGRAASGNTVATDNHATTDTLPATSTRAAKERRARKRETVLAGAAALRRSAFTAGMWATRAPVWFWPALLVITAVSGALRLFRLDFPHRLIFDETYYVKDSYSVINFGYERAWPENADDSFNAGDPSIIENSPEYVVHPPLGKWIIGLGIEAFGADDSFGWRFSVAIVGTLTVFLIGVVAWKLFRSAFFACVAALLLSIDGEHFVHSRTSLLDIVLMAFILLAFLFLLLDREQVTKRLARWAAETRDPGAEAVAASTDPSPTTSPTSPTAPTTSADHRKSAATRRDALNFGPRLGVRPWLIAAGIALGMAMGVKWSGLYALAAFGILVVAWDVHSRHRAGVVHPWLGTLLRDSVPSFLKLVPTALVTYVATWAGWIASDDAWDRQWAAENPGWWQSLPSWLDWIPSLAHYHYTAYSFHVGLDAEHPYMSNPWGWIVQWRPTSFYYESLSRGDLGCAAAKCSSAITSVGNPVIWGLAPVAVLAVLAIWILRRDVRAGVILAGLAATWLPWFAYQDRTIFTFYTIVMVPYVVLALTFCLTVLWGRRTPAPLFASATASPATASLAPAIIPASSVFDPPRRGGPEAEDVSADAAPTRRRTRPAWPLLGRRLVVGLILAAAVLAFAYFWPIYTGEVIPFDAWNNRMWNVTWR